MNTQQYIINGVKQLLYNNDYLVIPGFGGFVLKHRHSHYTTTGGAIAPPTKIVGFNLQLKQNDGVLQQWLQQTLKCSAQEALSHLTEFSDYCNSVLKTKRRITFENIGFFYLDFESNVCFEPQVDVNFFTESFGLTSVAINQLEPIQVKISEPVFEDRLLTDLKAAQPSLIKKSRLRYVTPILLVASVLSFVILIAANSKITGTLQAALNGSSGQSVYKPVAYSALKLESFNNCSTTYLVDANGFSNIKLNSGKSKVVKVKVLSSPALSKDVSVINKSTKISNQKNYEIVLGCFTIKANANRMAKKLNNLGASVSEKNEKGMHVVSIGNFSTRDEAIQKLSSLKDTYPKAWIKNP